MEENMAVGNKGAAHAAASGAAGGLSPVTLSVKNTENI